MSSKKSIRKVALTSIAASAAVVAVAPAVSADTISFSDIKPGEPHYDSVIALAEQGVIKGLPDGSFAPYQSVTRSQVALMFQRALNLQEPSTAEINSELRKYTDVKPSDSNIAGAVTAVSKAGIFEGVNGKFSPWSGLTREQMASVLVRAYNLDKLDTGKDVEINVANATPNHAANIQVLANLGITIETKDFRPFEKISRAAFSSMIDRTQKAVENGASVKLPAVKSINALNSTTVEIKFEDDVKNVSSIDFKVAGLTVKNAVNKQDSTHGVNGVDRKTVILTTSDQKGGEEYTVSADGKNIGKFTGIANVIPTDIHVLSNSQQGVVGKETTVKAEVEVPEGQSKEGIPVTFNIKTDNTKFNKDHVVEVLTDKDGVASYSYTQYAGGTDQVIAYATGQANVRATNGKVYWGVQDRLAVTEVTSGTELANGSKKVYKVKATKPDGTPLTDWVNGKEEPATLNIAFKENVDVAPDKGIKDKARVTDATSGSIPYQYTNNNTSAVTVKLDKNGEATFTVEGSDVAVTPIVFHDDNNNGKLEGAELQAQAAKVEFKDIQKVALDVKSIGTKDAAYDQGTAISRGGRDYEVTVRDKDGKLAPAGTKAYLTVKKDELKGNVAVLDKDEKEIGKLVASPEVAKSITLTTDSNGVAKFTLVGEKNAYATPTVYLNNGKDPLEFDSSDAQSKGEIVYFGDAVIESATLEVKNKKDLDKEVGSVATNETAVFEYQVVDQNGKAYKGLKDGQTVDHTATFEVYNNGYNEIALNDAAETKIAPHKTKSVKIVANKGLATLEVTSKGATKVDVNASSSQYSLANKSASVNFTSGTVVEEGKTYEAVVKSYDKDKKTLTLTIAGFDYEVTYNKDAVFKDGNVVSLDSFEKDIKEGTKLNYTKLASGDQFNITKVGTGTPETPTPSDLEATANVVKDVTIGTSTSLEASDLATGSGELTFKGQATPADSTVATADITDGKLVITAAEGATANATTTVNVTVTDGKKEVTGKVEVKIVDEAQQTATLESIGATITNDALGFNRLVGITVDQLKTIYPEADKTSTVEITTADNKTYTLEYNEIAEQFMLDNITETADELKTATVTVK